MTVSTTYKESGVDIDAGDELVRRLKMKFPHIGGFGGLYPLGDSFLVAGTDGVGTKLKVAFEMGVHDTIGIDLVAMSVNDVVTTGAVPLFFLDYFATSVLDVDVAEKVLEGIAAGCSEAGCVLLGGETAEMPGFYHEGEYDLSGFCVGIVHKDELFNSKEIDVGDAIVGIPSTGFHSNGYSLVRKVLEKKGITFSCSSPFSEGTVGDALLRPTRIYVKDVLAVKERYRVKAACHITGGGVLENIPRVLAEGQEARIFLDSWEVPKMFRWLQEEGGISESEMFRTFNMGIGMVLVMPQKEALAFVKEENDCILLGEIAEGRGVSLV